MNAFFKRSTLNVNMIRNYFILLVLIWIISACINSDEQISFEKDAFKTPESFTETNNAGEIISEDKDDWRVSPFYLNVVEVFRPAYPNPTVVQYITVEFLVSGIESVSGLVCYVLRQDRSLSQVYRNSNDVLPTGLISVQLDPSLFAYAGTISGAQGLHRLLFYDINDRLITYGDVKIEQ